VVRSIFLSLCRFNFTDLQEAQIVEAEDNQRAAHSKTGQLLRRRGRRPLRQSQDGRHGGRPARIQNQRRPRQRSVR